MVRNPTGLIAAARANNWEVFPMVDSDIGIPFQLVEGVSDWLKVSATHRGYVRFAAGPGGGGDVSRAILGVGGRREAGTDDRHKPSWTAPSGSVRCANPSSDLSPWSPF